MIAAGSGEVEINIPSADYIRREQFADYYCRAEIFPGNTFPLELIGITPKANANQLYTMRLRMKKSTDELPGPGMSVMVTIQFQNEGTQTFSIPLSAIYESPNNSTVWVYDPVTETVATREITLTEILKDGRAVVSAGLQAGELVVTAGIHSLKEGQKVKLLPPVTVTNVGGML